MMDKETYHCAVCNKKLNWSEAYRCSSCQKVVCSQCFKSPRKCCGKEPRYDWGNGG